MRRRDLLLVTASVLVLVLPVLVVAAVLRTRDRDAPPGVRAGLRRPDVLSPVRHGDVDGDGKADAVRLVGWTEESLRWLGVRVEASRLGRRTAWTPVTDPAAAEVLGFADVDGNRAAEVLVRTGSHDQVVTLAGREWTYARSTTLRVESSTVGTTGWGCADGRLYFAIFNEAARYGRVTYYRLDGARFVEVETDGGRYPAGTKVPDHYGPAVRCGDVRR